MLKCLIMAFMKVKKRVKCHDIMVNKRHPNSEVWMPLIFLQRWSENGFAGFGGEQFERFHAHYGISLLIQARRPHHY